MPLSSAKNPTRLGRYEILDEVGKGAMGVVYLAKDPLIGRLVALKTFRIGYSLKDQEMEQFRARFMREAQSAGILSHPNIVTIHDVVEQSEEGLAFIAMEYVRGTNLKVLLQRETPLDLPYIAGILTQIADGLDYAHSKGVVHRDVKPANIIITADNRAKITDFGIARIDTSNLTQEGQLLGTPNYMAPEQILGREVDHRADIFSLGVVLYEMLTRHKPFQGENLTVVSHRIVYDHFTPPKDYVGNLPPGVEPILSRALDKEPGRRFQRARELAADFARLVSARIASESLNETQSLSGTLVAPAAPVALPPAERPAGAPTASLAPMAPMAPKKPGILARFRRPAAAPSPPAAAMAPVLTPPPPAGTGGTGTGTGTGSGSSGALGGERGTGVGTGTGVGAGSGSTISSVPVLTPPRRSRGLVPLLVGVALLVVAAVAAGWLWTVWRQPAKVARPAAPAAPRVAPKPAAAPAPSPAVLAEQQRAAAAATAAEVAKQAERKKEIDDRLAQARTALERRHYDEAVAAASAVLALDAENPDAKGMLAAVDKAERRRDRLAQAKDATPPRPKTTDKLPPASLPATPPAAQPVTPVATEGSLHVTFVAKQLPDDGVLVVYINGSQAMRERFDFRQKAGFLRTVPGSGKVDKDITIPAGTAEIRIYATYGSKTSEVKTLSGNFLGGVKRVLTATLTPDGKLGTRLE